MLKIGLIGSTGKMGTAVIQSAYKMQDTFSIEGSFSTKNNINELENVFYASDIIIDFSNPSLLNNIISASLKYNKKLVIGTTGFTQEQFEQIENLSHNIPVLYSANMSIGAILVSKIIQDISKILDSDFDIDILDIHHNHKKDRPSGTSLMYAKILADITNKKIITNNIGIREKNTIECLSIRSAMAYGSHTITFTGNDEVISVNHQALNRTIFAKGALKAALWLSNKSKGLYSMMDMLEY